MMNTLYFSERLEHPKVVKDEVYMGYRYIILSLGTHPTAYICLPVNHIFHGKSYDELNCIDCHYGLTYSRDYLGREDIVSSDEGFWIIGWDYTHAGDWSGMYSDEINTGLGNRKYSLDEIVGECEYVIKQLIVRDKQ